MAAKRRDRSVRGQRPTMLASMESMNKLTPTVNWATWGCIGRGVRNAATIRGMRRPANPSQVCSNSCTLANSRTAQRCIDKSRL